MVAYFSICSTFNTTEKTLPGKLASGRYIIITIEHVVNWRLIYQRKQTFIDEISREKIVQDQIMTPRLMTTFYSGTIKPINDLFRNKISTSLSIYGMYQK